MTERKDITQDINTNEQATTQTYTPSELVKRIDGLDSTAGLARWARVLEKAGVRTFEQRANNSRIYTEQDIANFEAAIQDWRSNHQTEKIDDVLIRTFGSQIVPEAPAPSDAVNLQNSDDFKQWLSQHDAALIKQTTDAMRQVFDEQLEVALKAQEERLSDALKLEQSPDTDEPHVESDSSEGFWHRLFKR